MLSNQSRRAAVYVGGGALLVAWLAAANTTPRADPPSLQAPQQFTAGGDEVAVLQNEAAQLRDRLAKAPSPSERSRNPFSFAPVATAPAAVSRRVEAPRAADEIPAAPPLPLTLMGIAEQPAASGTVRTAILGGMGDEIYMVTVGQTVAARYSVTAIDVDAIELKDLSTGGFRRLALK